MEGAVVRFEIGCRDADAISDFYKRVFDWKIDKSPMGAEVDTGTDDGVNGAITALGHEPHNYVKFYIEVADADKACETIKAHGGAVEIGPIEIPGGKGRFAWFKDPEGNGLAIFEAPTKGEIK